MHMSADGPWRYFDAALAEGRFVCQRCRACGAAFHRPRVACPACGSAEYDWLDSAGVGTVYSATEVARRRRGADTDEPPPDVVVLVDLDEGVRVMGRSAGPVLAIDERVVLALAEVAGSDEVPLLFRRLADA